MSKKFQYFANTSIILVPPRRFFKRSLKRLRKIFRKILRKTNKSFKARFWPSSLERNRFPNAVIKKKRVAILFFGLLNTFDQINQESSSHVGIYKVMKSLGYKIDVFFDTSELAFLKIPSTMDPQVDSNAIQRLASGRSMLAKTKDYLVLEDPADKIESRLRKVIGKDLVSLHFTKTDPATWSGPKYLLNMIKTYLYRKKRLLSTCLDYAARKNIIYDAIVIARPDSAFKVRFNSSRVLEDVSHALREDLERVILTGDTGVDHWPHNARCSEEGVHMLKGAVIIASHNSAEYIGRLIDVIDEHGYTNAYSNAAFLCESCKALFRGPAIKCPSCGVENPRSIENWPEYKYAEHIKAGNNPFFVLSITGDTVRK